MVQGRYLFLQVEKAIVLIVSEILLRCLQSLAWTALLEQFLCPVVLTTTEEGRVIP